MFEIFHETHFAGAHYLRNYNGACENLHGHNWKVKATVRTEQLDHIGIGIDFKTLKKHVNTVLDQLDHTCLNDGFFTEEYGNPSSENISKWLYGQIGALVDSEPGVAKLCRIDVWETPGNCASYYEL